VADLHLACGVRRPAGLHLGNLKRIGAVWKFKAVGYDAAVAAPEAAAVSAALGVTRLG